jgi:uncharacterized membrane protein
MSKAGAQTNVGVLGQCKYLVIVTLVATVQATRVWAAVWGRRVREVQGVDVVTTISYICDLRTASVNLITLGCQFLTASRRVEATQQNLLPRSDQVGN